VQKISTVNAATFPFEQAPTLFGRLVRSASGEEHSRAFLDWLQLRLELQLADLEEFLGSLPEEQRIDMEAWLATGSYSDLVPDDARDPERLLFLSDLEVILAVRRIP